MTRMQGKVAIVTGGGSGIGEATVRLLHAEGAAVVIPDIDVARADALAAELRERAASLAMNVIDPAQWYALLAFTVARFGRIDVLVNNAGATFGAMSVADETVDGHRAILDVNLSGVWAGLRAVLPIRKAQGAGSIVNVSSIDGLVGVAHMTTYVATKFAVTGMTKSVALEAGATACASIPSTRESSRRRWSPRYRPTSAHGSRMRCHASRSRGRVARKRSPKRSCSSRRTRVPIAPARSW